MCHTVNNNPAVSAIYDNIDIVHGCKGFISPLICMMSHHQHHSPLQKLFKTKSV